MRDRFYIPTSLRIGGKPIIVWMLKDSCPLGNILDRSDPCAIATHLKRLYTGHRQTLSHGTYHIVFLWNLAGKLMTDVWIHSTNTIDEGSGPLQKVITFQGLDRFDIEISSGDTLMVLGLEETLRRNMDNTKKYVQRPTHMPVFSEGMQPWEEFYSSGNKKLGA